jgi:hypothetical protein
MENMFANAANWILNQAGLVILAALVILGLRAWMNGQIMPLFGGIVVAGILYLFTLDSGQTLLNNLATAIQTIFETGGGGT